MKTRIIHSKNLSSECWYVQAWGLTPCGKCCRRETKKCGGVAIRKTGKNAAGKRVPID